MIILTPPQLDVLRAACSPWFRSPTEIRVRSEVPDALRCLQELHRLGFVEEDDGLRDDDPVWYRATREGAAYVQPTRGLIHERSDHGDNLIVTITRRDIDHLQSGLSHNQPVTIRDGELTPYDNIEIRLGHEAADESDA